MKKTSKLAELLQDGTVKSRKDLIEGIWDIDFDNCRSQESYNIRFTKLVQRTRLQGFNICYAGRKDRKNTYYMLKNNNEVDQESSFPSTQSVVADSRGKRATVPRKREGSAR